MGRLGGPFAIDVFHMDNKMILPEDVCHIGIITSLRAVLHRLVQCS